MKKTKRLQLLSCILAVMMVIGLMASLMVPVSAAAMNQSVTNAKKGVVQIQVWFSDPEAAVEAYLQSGTGFLINDTTILTCQHVVTAFPDSWYANWAQQTNKELGIKRTATEIKEHLELRAIIYRDTYVTANVINESEEMDFAILELEKSISNRESLALRDSESLNQTEEVFALGFPGDLDEIAQNHYYDTDDVTVTSGHVNKVDDFSFSTFQGQNYDGVNCVESSALLAAGNSGGPLVDADGNVVGINAAGSSTRNLSVSIGQIMKVLDALGIEYTKPPVPVPPVPVVPEVDTADLTKMISKAEKKLLEQDQYTAESFAAMSDALEDAKDALTAEDQGDIDDATEKLEKAIDSLAQAESGINMTLIIIIVAAVVVVLLVVVLIIVMAKKNSKPAAAPAPAAKPAAPVAPAARPVAPAVPQAPPARPAAPAPAPAASETTVLSQGAGETTVLSQGAGETTVLSQQVNGGSLLRVSNNERIPVSSASFTVGRERNKVDYCVGGNTNISRVHATFVVKDGKTYIVDNNAANGTFVNGVKARAGQEIELKSGDKIVLADEKFEFTK